jgi:hypothetical protein
LKFSSIQTETKPAGSFKVSEGPGNLIKFMVLNLGDRSTFKKDKKLMQSVY